MKRVRCGGGGGKVLEVGRGRIATGALWGLVLIDPSHKADELSGSAGDLGL